MQSQHTVQTWALYFKSSSCQMSLQWHADRALSTVLVHCVQSERPCPEAINNFLHCSRALDRIPRRVFTPMTRKGHCKAYSLLFLAMHNLERATHAAMRDSGMLCSTHSRHRAHKEISVAPLFTRDPLTCLILPG